MFSSGRCPEVHLDYCTYYIMEIKRLEASPLDLSVRVQYVISSPILRMKLEVSIFIAQSTVYEYSKRHV